MTLINPTVVIMTGGNKGLAPLMRLPGSRPCITSPAYFKSLSIRQQMKRSASGQIVSKAKYCLCLSDQIVRKATAWVCQAK